jgi:hypothetical protein
LSSVSPATITITLPLASPTPTADHQHQRRHRLLHRHPTDTDTNTDSLRPSTNTDAKYAQAPTCQSLTLSGATNGTAPYSLTFTATGTSSASTISKVTFNFGDSAIQDVPQSGGPSSVSVQASHTYNSAGTFVTSCLFNRCSRKCQL